MLLPATPNGVKTKIRVRIYDNSAIRDDETLFLCDASAEEIPGSTVDVGHALRDGLLVEGVDELVVVIARNPLQERFTLTNQTDCFLNQNW